MSYIDDKAIERYFDDIPKGDLLTREEERELSYKIQEGDQKAKKELARNNLRLVISIAKEYRGMGVDFLDLIQAGNVGLLRAERKFDPERGNKFSTYATSWIKQGIRRELSNNSKTIRIPESLNKVLRDLDELEKEYELEYGREPTLEEMEDELDHSEQAIDRALKARRVNGRSLNEKLGNGEDGDKEMLSTIGGKDYDPETSASNEKYSMLNLINTCYEKGVIKDRKKRILLLRYGLEMRNSLNLTEVGEILDISRERVRQLQDDAEDAIEGYVYENYMDGIGNYIEAMKN